MVANARLRGRVLNPYKVENRKVQEDLADYVELPAAVGAGGYEYALSNYYSYDLGLFENMSDTMKYVLIGAAALLGLKYFAPKTFKKVPVIGKMF